MENTFNVILNDNEVVLWHGKPNLTAYIIRVASPILWTSLFIGITGIIYSLVPPYSDERKFSTLYISFAVLGCTFIFYIIIGIIKVIELRNIHYFFTDQRVIIQNGIFSYNYRNIEYSKIEDILVKRGLLNSIFKTGNICFVGNNIVNNQLPVIGVLFHIDNPYEIFKLIKKISTDIRTDINYPNDLRPKENHGYNTKYKP